MMQRVGAAPRWAAMARPVVAAALLWPCFVSVTLAQGRSAAGPPTMPVEAEAVVIGRWEQAVSAIGSLSANESVVVRPEVSGRIKTINFEEGRPVAEGTVLFRLDAGEYEAQVEQSRTALRLAEITFARSKDLRAKNLVSQQEFDEAQAKLEESRAKLVLDQARLDKMTLRAPFHGVMGVRKVSVGAYVKEGDEMVSLDDIDPIKVDVRVPEPFIRLIGSKQQFRVTVAAYPGQVFAGEVYAVDPSLDTASRTVLLRGRVNNDSGLLRPGMFADLSVTLSTIDNAVIVPERAVVPMGEKQMIYRVVDGKAQLVNVEIADRQAGKVLIKSGVSAGDTVITAGQTKIRDGMGVMVISGAGAAVSAGSEKR
jgi:membrane fusion protein (multidrug efflux system)